MPIEYQDDGLYAICDTCGKEACIDHTGECAAPLREMMPNGWKTDGEYVTCSSCEDALSQNANPQETPDVRI